MLFKKTKKDALEIHERAIKKYKSEYEHLQSQGSFLYQRRRESIMLISEIESLISSIANNPKEFEKSLLGIQAERKIFHDTEEYAKEAASSSVKSGINAAGGVAMGMAAATMAPTAAMWVATTFGTASTGTAISALHGAAATKAALAWLGGGTLSAGGAGIAGGQALLALAGPLGWGITGASTAISAFATGRKNKQVADRAIEEAKRITMAGAELHETSAKIQDIIDKTTMLYGKLEAALSQCLHMEYANYLSLPAEEQKQLGALVNNTFSLAELLNKTI